MESMMGYRLCSLPHQYSIHLSSGYSAEISMKPCCLSHSSTTSHLSFSRSSFPKSLRGRTLERILGPTACTLGASSTSEKSTNSPPHTFSQEHFEQAVLVAKGLNESGHDNISQILMKIHRPSIPKTAQQYDQNVALMEILIRHEMFKEALKYSESLDSNESYKPPVLTHFQHLKFVILCGLDRHNQADGLYGQEFKKKNDENQSQKGGETPGKRAGGTVQQGGNVSEPSAGNQVKQGGEAPQQASKDQGENVPKRAAN